MFNITRQGNHSTAYVTEYVADTAEDVAKLPIDSAPGSTCVIIDTGDVYILSNEKEWKKLSGSAAGGGVGSIQWGRF